MWPPTDGHSPHPSYSPAMFSDLDTLLRERGIEATSVPMAETLHPYFGWISRGARVKCGYAIKLAGGEPLLVSYPMERDEAAAAGLETRLVHEFGYDDIFRDAPNPAAGYAVFFDAVLRALGVQSSIAFFGNLPIQLYHGVIEQIASLGWRGWRADGTDLIQLARKRKEPWEIEAIRSAGERTEQVVDGVRRILREGSATTLGNLKDFVTTEITRLGMVEDHQTILSQGRDAGVPHSRGDAHAPFRPSVPLVLDIFPVDRASGYFFDLTRTFCIGPIPEELRRIHADVLEAFERARDAMKAGTPASFYQALVCDFFEAKGYATTRSNPATLEGYVHSLGHEEVARSEEHTSEL